MPAVVDRLAGIAYLPGMTTALELTSLNESFLLKNIKPLQQRLAEHPLYGSIQTLRSLQVFMESHVYAVWDFMSLLKALQQALTSVEVPWRPTPNPRTRRLLNEIVLGEESDLYQGSSLSHFELYLQAMRSCEADVSGAERLITALGAGCSVEEAMADAPMESQIFVKGTFAVLGSGATHRIAAAFTFGREDLIPEMFTAFVRKLDGELGGHAAPFRYYLERHIEVDGEEHRPMALAMLQELCPTGQHWAEATESAVVALEARLAFWDGIHARILAAGVQQ